MKRTIGVVSAALALVASTATAHRVDEYLQATTILVSEESVRVDVRLAPGVAVAPSVLDSIDVDHDGSFSEAEQTSYAQRVLGDLTLTLDELPVPMRLVSRHYASAPDLRNGMGQMDLSFIAPLSSGSGTRHLSFDNRHRAGISAYLVNALEPTDEAIHIAKQDRNYTQSRYEMTFAYGGMSFGALTPWAIGVLCLVIAAVSYRRRAR